MEHASGPNFAARWPLLAKRATKLSEDVDKHEIWLLAGSIAYTTALALAPFVLIMLSVASLFGESLQQKLVEAMTSAMGEQAGRAVELVVQHAGAHPKISGISGLIGLFILAVSASAIFSQLRAALDKINEWKPDHPTSGIWSFIKDRFLSIGLVFGFIFLSIVSLLLTTAIAIIFGGSRDGVLWHWVSIALNFVIFSLLFSAMYRFIPSRGLEWRRCVVAGVVSAVFYVIGKFLIGLYLGTAGVGSLYGAAGSIVVFLAWVYYSASALLLSYEFTNDMMFYRPQ